MTSIASKALYHLSSFKTKIAVLKIFHLWFKIPSPNLEIQQK